MQRITFRAACYHFAATLILVSTAGMAVPRAGAQTPTLTVDAAANVAITAQPASQTVVVGQSATLTVAATGSAAGLEDGNDCEALATTRSSSSNSTSTVSASFVPSRC